MVYTATGAVGFVGFLNGMRMKGEKWTVSQDARNHGGRIPLNIAEALATHALTPEQAIRKTLESDLGASGFTGAVTALSDMPIVDDVYYVMAGAPAITWLTQQPGMVLRMSSATLALKSAMKVRPSPRATERTWLMSSYDPHPFPHMCSRPP
jgi:hypothetical protein